MKEDFFENGGHDSRDGYTPQSRNGSYASNARQPGTRSARPRFARESKVGSSNMRSSRPGGNYSEGYGRKPYPGSASRYEGNGNEIPSRRFFSPRGDAPGGYERPYRQGSRDGFDGGKRWNKQRTPYSEGQRFNDGEGTYHQRERFAGEYRNDREGGFFPRGRMGGFSGGRPNPYGAPRGRNGEFKPRNKYSQKKRIEYSENNIDPNQPVRLNKFLANAGVCSRRDADKYIQAGVVTVNGEVVTELGTKVMRTDTVLFHDNAVRMEKKQYVLLNKPKGYVTTSEDPQNRKTVMDLVRNACPERIYPVGRLDRNTTGVLLLTNDGEMASRLTHPKFLKKKIYHVTTDQNVTAADLRQIAEGITLEDGEIKADAVEYASETDKKQVGIEIHSGRNRIVRRIFEALGYHVVKLDRVYFAGLTKKNVKRGDWRYLTEQEVNMLRMGAFE